MNRLLLVLGLGATVLYAQDGEVASRAVGILEQKCFGCHSSGFSQSGLRLDSRSSSERRGTRGPTIVAGNAAASRLVQAIRRTG